MKSDEMAQLFNIDLSEIEINDSPDDYGVSASESESIQSFENKCKDIKDITKSEDDIISDALNNHLSNNKNTKANSNNSHTSDHINDADNTIEDNNIKINTDSVPIMDSQDSNIPTENIIEDGTLDNPLDLSGDLLRAYKDITSKYPQFKLYDNTSSFKEFYRFKVMVLTSLCSRFPVLKTAEIAKEISSINTDHYVGESYISPEILRQKLDECYKSKCRLSALLINIFEQYPAWKRFTEMLKSKLWKDHELKGTHRRDGLTLEHMFDMEEYVSYLEGILDAAKHADNLLKAAADSLSRQLSCLQIKHAVGIISSDSHNVTNDQSQKHDDLDGYDSVLSGEVIAAPQSSEEPCKVDFGVEPDDLASLGG